MGVMSDLIRRGSPVDALQSASNAVAGMASFPVDAITWALRKGGVDIKNPVGGSDWMADKGLTKEVPQSAYSLAGETVGNLLPFASGPKTAAAVARAGEAAQKGTKAVGNATVDALREGTEGYMSKAGLKPEGLSPLARGNLAKDPCAELVYGPIPARAGQPAWQRPASCVPGAYPRSRGATTRCEPC